MFRNHHYLIVKQWVVNQNYSFQFERDFSAAEEEQRSG